MGTDGESMKRSRDWEGWKKEELDKGNKTSEDEKRENGKGGNLVTYWRDSEAFKWSVAVSESCPSHLNTSA